MRNKQILLSGRAVTTNAVNVPADRYSFLHLSDAEPNLGIASANGWVLVYDTATPGNRLWSKNLITAYDHANSAYGSQNTTGVYANAAFLKANSAYDSQNVTGTYANNAYLRANNSLNANVGGTVTGNVTIIGNLSSNILTTTGSGGDITGANAIFATYIFAKNIDLQLLANAAYAQANSASLYANGAFVQANASYGSQNVTGTYANNAYDQANSAASYANSAFLKANSAYASQNVTGTYANNAYTQANASFIKANSAYESQNTTGVYANAAYAQANSASLYANGAFVQANAAYGSQNTTGTYANAAFLKANSAYASQNVTGTYANSAFTAANNAQSVATSALTSATAAHIKANAAFIQANATQAFAVTVNTTATASYIKANAAYESQNVTGTYANNAYAQANSASLYANGAFVQANAGFLHANSAYESQNTTGVYANAAFLKANSAYESQNVTGTYANNAYVRANNSLNANVGGTVTGPVTVQGDFSVVGNVFLTGNTFSISVGSIVSNDSLLILGANNFYSDTVDIGFSANYNDGVNAHSGLIRDATDKEWYLFKGYTPEVSPNNNIIITHPSFMADTLNANLRSNNTIVRSIEIGYYANASFLQANTAYASQNVTGTYANNAYSQSNSAASYANSAFVKANSAYGSQNVTGTYANNAYLHANSGFIHANSAFETINNLSFVANTTNTTVIAVNDHSNAAFLKANSAYASQNVTGTYANAAYAQANSAALYANGAFIAANTADDKATSAGIYANGAFLKANSAYASQNVTGTYANNSYAQANSASLYANGAFIQANAAYEQANSASPYANAAFLKANSAYESQNTTGVYANAAYSQANSAALYANGAFIVANTPSHVANSAALYANGAFVQSNAAYGSQNTTGVYANAAYSQANSAALYANGAFVQSNASFHVANSAALYANGAFIQANASYGSQNVTGTYANAAFIHANAAFNVANNSIDTYVRAHANASYNTANAAFVKANAAVFTITANSYEIYTNTSTGNIQIGLANVNASIGTYGGATAIPVINVDGYGRVQSVSNTTITVPPGTYIFPNTGQLTTNSNFGNVLIGLANVNSTIGTFGGASVIPIIQTDGYGRITNIVNSSISIPSGTNIVNSSFITANSPNGNVALSFANSGVTSGTYGGSGNVPVITVDQYGRITVASETASSTNALSTIIRNSYTATAAQTAFNTTTSFTPGYADVYVNGLKLSPADYTANPVGSINILNPTLIAGDAVDIQTATTFIVDANTKYEKTTFTATAGQTTFTASYTPNSVNVYLNGLRLKETDDFVANNGSTVALTVACELNDIVEIERAGMMYTYLDNLYLSTRYANTAVSNGQTTFTVTGGYKVGFVDVYLNGIKLNSPSDVLASDGSTIVMQSAIVETGDIIEVIGIGPEFTPANAIPITGGTVYGSLSVLNNVNVTNAITSNTLNVSSANITSNLQVSYNITANAVNVATVYFNDGTKMITAASGSGTGITWKIISANTTANTTEGFLVDTTTANVYITLNSSPSLGNTARIVDMAGNFAINNCIIKGNGSKVMGSTDDFIISSNNAGIGLVYSNATYGWRIIENP